MLRIRTIEKEIARRYAEHKIRTPIHLSIGQESAAVGVCSSLGPDDLVISTHRSHAHYLAKGGDLNAFIAELHGKQTGCSGGFGGSMHLVDRSCGFMGSTSIVAGSVPVGVGMAFAKSLRGDPGIVVIFHGDAAIEEGVWHESVNFAVLKKLPVLFVCENNGFSCYTPLKERQPRDNFKALAKGHGLKYGLAKGSVGWIQVKAKAALKIATKRPMLLEIPTERWYEHCGVKKELDGVDDISGMSGDEFMPEIDRAFEFAEESPWPRPLSCP
jgi:pyruvate dehydrogenase E1 component alpha subunit